MIDELITELAGGLLELAIDAARHTAKWAIGGSSAQQRGPVAPLDDPKPGPQALGEFIRQTSQTK